MSIGPLGPGEPGQWDDLFARFFGAAEPRRAQRIDITKYMSNDAREVLSVAARRAAELADPGKDVADLDTDHLLWAALQHEPLKAGVRRAGADPEALLAALGRPSRRPDDPMPEQVALTPAAKRALLDSLQLSRALGASYVGPEHILMALGLPAGWTRAACTRRRRRPAAVAAVTRPRWSSTASTSPRWRGAVRSTRSSAGPRRSSRPSRCCRGAPRTTRC
jgi:hypothetical protein